MQAIRIHRAGGPEVLTYEATALPEPGAGQARVRIEAAGLNYIDVYHRSGLYSIPTPFTPGVEGAGVVEAVGADVRDVAVGDRVAYAMQMGAYADYAIVDTWKLVPIPDGVSTEAGAAVMLQGMTAHYLAYSTYPLQEGDVALVHAAAGGVGLLLVQIARKCGAQVIGTVSTEEKEMLAREAGADEVIRYTQADFEEETLRLTDGAGVHVVYDAVGRTTFEQSLNCLRPRGMLVLYGQASGPIPPFDAGVLGAKGSLFLTRPSLGHYTANRDELLRRSGDLFRWMTAGELDVRIDQIFPLAEAADAHRTIEARKSKGKILLIP